MSGLRTRGLRRRSRAGSTHPAGWCSAGCAILLLAAALGAGAELQEGPIAAIEDALLEGRYQQVIALSESVPGADAGELAFYRGVAFRELGNVSAAEEVLREYLRAGGVFADEAQRLLAQMEEEAAVATAPRRLRTLVQAGIVYDSRVVVRQEDPPYFREEDDLAARLSLAMDLDATPRVRLRYRGHWLQYLEWTEAARLDQSLSVGVRTPVLGGDLEWTALGESELRDGDPVFWRMGARAELAWLVAEDRIAWTALEAGQDLFPESDAFDGVYGLASLGYEQYFARGSLLWDLFGQWHDAAEDPLRFYEAGLGVASSYAIADGLAGGLSARVSRILYDTYDPVYAVERDDLCLSARAWISVALGAAVSLVPSVEAVADDSNVDGADYDEHVVAVDVVWSRW